MKSKLFTKKVFIPIALILAVLLGTCVVARQTVVKERLEEMAYWDEFDSKMSSDGLYFVSFYPDEQKNKVGCVQFFHGNHYHLPVSKIPCYFEDIKIKGILENSYVECINLEKVIIPQTIEYIQENAFLNCKDLKEIHIPASVTSISKTAFKGTNNFKMFVEKNSTAETFAKENKIDFDYYEPEPIKKDTSEYPKYAFELSKDGLIYNIYYNENKPYCAIVQFNAMSEEKNYKIPEKIDGVPVVNIMEQAFSWCQNVENITLPDSIKTVGNYAFVQCRNLKKVYFTENVTSIGKKIFQKSKKAIICAPKNSYAHKYAIENNIPFEETK